MGASGQPPKLAVHGWAGLVLLGVCWPLNWMLPGRRTAYLFFPLWLGYALFVDALVCRRVGGSLWTQRRRDFCRLFLLSAPAWWVFECINWRTGNWEYRGGDAFNPVQYVALCTLSFSTVMPAVFETAELVRTFRWVEALPGRPRLPETPLLWGGVFATGLVMLTLLLLWPGRFYPLTWISLWLILEPINRWLGRRHLLAYVQRGDWRPVVSLSLGALICGFFWELWNYWSWPQWVYHTPGVDYWHVFAMPLLGYGGYVPFAWELFALMNFLAPRAPVLHL